MKIDKKEIARHLRQQQTPAEKKLWEILRNRQFENLKFRRQHPLKDYIVDFYCHELELVIELDGAYQNEKKQKYKDEQRGFHLSFLGYRILRYFNEVVFSSSQQVLEEIKSIKNNFSSQWERARVREKTILSTKKLTSSQKKTFQNANISMTDYDAEEIKSEKEKLPSQPVIARLKEKSILSTKKLTSSQKKMFQNVNISVMDYDAIEITYLEFESPKKISCGIFTSQNAVKAFFSLHNRNSSQIEKVFCVGEKTKAILEENGQNVTKMMKNASDLASFIKETHKHETFHFFCGSLRRDEIPSALKKENIALFEVKTYETALKTSTIEHKWDGIMFFSPTGVQSFSAENKIENQRAFCIGKTTASEAKQHTINVFEAEKTTVESVIEKAINIVGET
jgi:uroporphyrinogen-III synthase